MTGVAPIQRLRRIVLDLRAGRSLAADDRSALVGAVDGFLRGEPGAETLDRAFGIRGRQGAGTWREADRLADRDKLVCIAMNAFFGGSPGELGDALSRYETDVWPRQRHQQWPAAERFAVDARPWLWAILALSREGADGTRALSVSHLRRLKRGRPASKIDPLNLLAGSSDTDRVATPATGVRR